MLVSLERASGSNDLNFSDLALTAFLLNGKIPLILNPAPTLLAVIALCHALEKTVLKS